MMRVYCDMEFTGLRHDAEIISIGIYSQGNFFYAESNEVKLNTLSSFHQDNIIPSLKFKNSYEYREHCSCLSHDSVPICYNLKGSLKYIKSQMLIWFKKMMVKYSVEKFRTYWDCPSFDWVLFNRLMATYSDDGYPVLPDFIFYLPIDIMPYFLLIDIDPDINRIEFLGHPEKYCNHNSLSDARMTCDIYKKIQGILERKMK